MPSIVPNFLYVGAGKAASSWTCEVLREHPQAFVAEAKDTMFFDRYYHKGWGWYLSHFADGSGSKAIGELSHDYFLSEEFAERIHRHVPEARILVCLREGVDRTFSEFLYDKTLFQFVSAERYESGLGFEQFARLRRIAKRSDYLNNLGYFFERFPRERILVQFYDDLQRDPGAFVRQLFSFLELDPDFAPPSLHRRVNTARQVRNTFLANLAYQAGQLLRGIGKPQFVGGLKRQRWMEFLLYRDFGKSLKKPSIPPDVRARLHPLYHRHDAQLARLIGRTLPARWTQIPGISTAAGIAHGYPVASSVTELDLDLHHDSGANMSSF
jgi:hypothetical protein